MGPFSLYRQAQTVEELIASVHDSVVCPLCNGKTGSPCGFGKRCRIEVPGKKLPDLKTDPTAVSEEQQMGQQIDFGCSKNWLSSS
jgi:hypothetical protein